MIGETLKALTPHVVYVDGLTISLRSASGEKGEASPLGARKLIQVELLANINAVLDPSGKVNNRDTYSNIQKYVIDKINSVEIFDGSKDLNKIRKYLTRETDKAFRLELYEHLDKSGDDRVFHFKIRWWVVPEATN